MIKLKRDVIHRYEIKRNSTMSIVREVTYPIKFFLKNLHKKLDKSSIVCRKISSYLMEPLHLIAMAPSYRY